MILVTGGTGLVGGHLLYRFRESELPITAIYREQANIATTRAIFNSYKLGDDVLVDRFNWVQADVTEIPSLEALMNGVTAIYHCAAIIEGSFEDLICTNVTGTANLINVALTHGVNRFCHVSSIAALGDPVGNKPVTEDDFFNLDGLNTDYAISKYGAEMEVWRASQEGMEVLIVNPGVILGEGNWNKATGKLFSKVARGFKYYTSGSSGFVDARDVAAAMELLMNSNLKNERFILVSENVTYKDLLQIIAASLNKKSPNILIKPWMLHGLNGIKWLGSLLGFKKTLSRATIKSLTNLSYYNNDKIKKELSYSFTPVNETIKRVSSCFTGQFAG